MPAFDLLVAGDVVLQRMQTRLAGKMRAAEFSERLMQNNEHRHRTPMKKRYFFRIASFPQCRHLIEETRKNSVVIRITPDDRMATQEKKSSSR